MASLTITVPDAYVPTVLAAFRAEFPDLDPTLTDAQVGRQGVVRLVRACVYRHGVIAAQQNAQADYDTAMNTGTSNLQANVNTIT